jgi:dTDP-4-amino-4,6-dideoxygalactose transaminase
MIAMVDFAAEPAELHEAMVRAARRVIASGRYILGSEVQAFEQRWAAACRIEHAVGVGNGLDALEIALRALGIGPGDEVIVPAMTAFASVLAVMRCGAAPVLADVDAQTALLSQESAGRCVGPRTRAVMLVHLYGEVRAMQAWTKFCETHQLHLVEDCAQSHLAAWKGRVAGSFGSAGAYSFYPTKNLGAVGDAGMVVMRDAALAERARRLRNYGQSDRYHHAEAGLNSRLDELHAAMLAEKLAWLPAFTERRRAIAQAYRDRLSNVHVRLLKAPEEPGAHVHHLFVVTCERRDALQAHLDRQGVQTLVHYPVPAHRQAPGEGLRRDPAGLGRCELHAASCLSIPCHPQMTDDDVERVIGAVQSFPG